MKQILFDLAVSRISKDFNNATLWKETNLEPILECSRSNFSGLWNEARVSKILKEKVEHIFFARAFIFWKNNFRTPKL